jgi:hypothetical protein
MDMFTEAQWEEFDAEIAEVISELASEWNAKHPVVEPVT